MSTIGVAFLGVGRMGETHLRNLTGLSGVRVLAVADPNREASERGKALANAEVALTEIEEAINHPGVDAVVIITPTETHARLIELAVQAGKAVFSEKPIALDLAETERVVKLAEEKDASVQIGFMRRFDPGYAGAKSKIEAGELGKLETFRALSRDTYPPSLKFLLSSGGLFLDMAVHDLDLARFLVGDVEEVQAWGSVLIDERFAQANDADTAVTMLRFKNGALGVVETSRRSNWGYDIRTEVAGSIGKVVVEAAQKTPLLFARDFASSYDHFENFPDRFEKAYRLQLESFFKDLQAGRKPSPGPGDALESLRLAIAVTKSWKESKPVKVSEVQ
ncbi:MAG TPA: Gfo/Idh/MocA family oxidoreductase [Terrimicrobiaceae bacterium]|nr:Gfo/Idh/MocA family oxidoreductase [Terrimicrobiaceae bacterium]